METKISLRVLALLVVTTSITLRLCLSNPLLDHFYSYSTEGGSAALKIHPGTWVILLGTAIIAILKTPVKFLNSQLNKSHRAVLYACIFLFLVMLYNTIQHGTSGLAYLIDTYLYAYLCLILINYLSQESLEKLISILAIILAVNCGIAIIEYSTQSTLLPGPIQFGFFRSNSLLGHPLNNALIIATFGIAALALNFNAKQKAIIWLLVIFGLLAFGARASTAVFLIFSAVYLLSKIKTKGSSRKRANQALLYISAAISSIAIAIYAIFYTSIGSSITERLLFDESAQTRIDAFNIFQGVSTPDIINGLGSTKTLNLFSLYLEGRGVENFWLFTLIQFGIPSFLLLYAPLARVILQYISKPKNASMILVLAFLIASSTNNSLSIKTPALAVFLILLRGIHINNMKILDARETQRITTASRKPI